VTQARRPTAVSLFSGAGGFDLGIEHAGFDVLACVEIDKHCCNTLKLNAELSNHNNRRVYHTDIREIDAMQLRKEMKLRRGSLDLLFGGPPCQSFSLIGYQSGLSDHRGLLIFEIPRFARELRPKVIVMEQVKGFLSANGLDGSRGGAKRELVAELESLGYSCQIQVLNARDFGVAQSRERVFLVAARTRRQFEYPEPTHGPSEQLFGLRPFTTVADAISGLRAPTARGGDKSVSDSHVDVTPERDRERISFVATGSCLAKSDAPPSVKGRLTAKDTTKFLRLDPSRQSNTLRCGEIFYHPTEDRYLTPREYMRIHSYPDEYRLTGPIRGRSGQVRDLDQHRQVANSVPPLLAMAVGEAVMRVLDTTDSCK